MIPATSNSKNDSSSIMTAITAGLQATSGLTATTRVSDPYSFFTDPDPDGGQYRSGYGSGSGSNPDPGL